MREVTIICSHCGRVCLDGQFIVLEAGAGAQALLVRYGERRELCSECLDRVNDLVRVNTAMRLSGERQACAVG
jgi:hypothetical protein